eukprot:PhF_6_TR10597/c0_g1_i6/m.17039
MQNKSSFPRITSLVTQYVNTSKASKAFMQSPTSSGKRKLALQHPYLQIHQFRKLSILGFIGLFLVHLQSRIRIKLTNVEVKFLTQWYDSVSGTLSTITAIHGELAYLGVVLSQTELDVMLKRHFFPSEKEQQGILPLPVWLWLFEHFKRKGVMKARMMNDANEAFSALGGDAWDARSRVPFAVFRDIVRTFQLKIDMDTFIAEADVDQSGEIDFMEFRG